MTGGRAGRRRDTRSRLGRRPHPAGGRPAPVRLRPRLPARRRGLRDAPGPRRPPDRAGRARRPTPSLRRRPRHRPARRPRRDARATGSPRCSPPTASTARTATPRSGSRSRAARSAAAASCPRPRSCAPTIAIQAWPVVPPPADHLERGLHLVASAVRRDPANPLVTLKTTSRADYVYARLEARRAGADDALFLTIDGHLSEGTTANIFLVRRGELATPSLDCAILPGTTRSWLLAWGGARRPAARSRAAFAPPTSPPPTRRSCRRRSRGSCRSRGSRARRSATGVPGPWTRRARADREAMILAGEDALDEARRAHRRDPRPRRRGRPPAGQPVAAPRSRSGSSARTTCSRRPGEAWIATTSRG